MRLRRSRNEALAGLVTTVARDIHGYGCHDARYSREPNLAPVGQILLPYGRNRQARESVRSGKGCSRW